MSVESINKSIVSIFGKPTLIAEGGLSQFLTFAPSQTDPWNGLLVNGWVGDPDGESGDTVFPPEYMTIISNFGQVMEDEEIAANLRIVEGEENYLLTLVSNENYVVNPYHNVTETTETPLLIQTDLYFGQNIPNGQEVSQQEFQEFVDHVITPRFPAGLTIFDANGQFLNSTGKVVQENTKVVSLFVEDTFTSVVAINEIVKAYNQQFQGAGVLQVTNQDDLKVGFGVGENLIDSDPVPELIQVELFFGRNIAGVGEVSQEEFQGFLDNILAPRVPGLIVFDANGQFQDSAGTVIKEPAKVVTLVLEDTETNEAIIDEIVQTYIQQFQQSSVLQAVNEDVTISFGPNDNLIENDPIPEFIQADLFFGRFIPGGGEVTQEQFQAFLDHIVTPRFPGLTVFDADGLFQDSMGTIIQEQTKVVSLIIEDTEQNETSVNEIVKEYVQQFQVQPASVLIVVDEDIQANFTAGATKVALPIDVGFEIPVLESTIFTGTYSFGELIPFNA
jgi:hypothetical protein